MSKPRPMLHQPLSIHPDRQRFLGIPNLSATKRARNISAKTSLVLMKVRKTRFSFHTLGIKKPRPLRLTTYTPLHQ